MALGGLCPPREDLGTHLLPGQSANILSPSLVISQLPTASFPRAVSQNLVLPTHK